MNELRRATLARLVPRRFATRVQPAEAELFVRNLPSGATAAQVRTAFAAACAVRGVRVPVDGAGQPRGFAFVTIQATEIDAACRAMDGAVLGGRKMAVKLQITSDGKASSIALNKQLGATATAADVLKLFEDKTADFDHVSFATALHRLGKFSRSFEKSSAPRLRKLVDRATSSIINDSKQWESRHLANACWGIAKIGDVEAPALFEAVAAEAPKKIATFTPQNLANTVWAYATAGVAAPALFEAVAAESSKKIATFNPQDLANTAWAYATAGVEALALFEAVAAEAPKNIVAFNSQDLANSVWAFATAGVAAPALFEAVAAEALKKIATFSPQALANTVWAYATAGVEAPALFEAVAAEASKRITMFNSQELANIVWAYSTMRVSAPALFEAVAAEAPKKIAAFTSQALANTVWAYATAGVEAPALFVGIAAEASKKIATFGSQALANTVWAYATAGVAAPALFEAVAAEAPNKIATFESQELANMVWAYSTAGIDAPALFEAVASESSKNIATFTPQALANTVWAYSTAGVAAPALFEVMALSIEAKMDEFSLSELSQMHQVYIHLRIEASQHPLSLLLSRHGAALREAYIRQEPKPSRSQREVSKVLARIGWAHEYEHVTAEGISLDMAQPASKIAVEFDGPTHYLAGSVDPTRVLDGASKFKERLLGSLGWKLVRVPYFKWMQQSSGAQKEAYLRNVLAAFGPSQGAVEAADCGDAPGPSRGAVEAADCGDAPANKSEAASRGSGAVALSRLTVKALKALLKERGLSQSGLKQALVQRLADDAEAPSASSR